MSSAFERLKEWDRKYYRFTIESNLHTMPGGGYAVTLSAGGREVVVEDYELIEKYVGYPTLDQVIDAALDKWHADDSMKHYRMFFDHADDPVLEDWSVWGGKMKVARTVARSEAEARAVLRAAYPPEHPPVVRGVYEVSATGRHT